LLPATYNHRWSNPRSEGKLMSFDLVDKAGGEIRATAWNDQVDQFQGMIQVRHLLLSSVCAIHVACLWTKSRAVL
jgi:hypothetical protein